MGVASNDKIDSLNEDLTNKLAILNFKLNAILKHLNVTGNIDGSIITYNVNSASQNTITVEFIILLNIIVCFIQLFD